MYVTPVAYPLTTFDVGIDGSALNRPRPDDRDLDREILKVLRSGAPQRLHLCPALDLEDTGGVRVMDALVRRRIVVGNAREVDPLAPRARDQLNATLDRRQHPQPQQIDLQEARISARVLVPLDDLTAFHRRRHDWTAVDQRTCGDDHPARMLREVPRKPVRFSRQTRARRDLLADVLDQLLAPLLDVFRQGRTEPGRVVQGRV